MLLYLTPYKEAKYKKWLKQFFEMKVLDNM